MVRRSDQDPPGGLKGHTEQVGEPGVDPEDAGGLIRPDQDPAAGAGNRLELGGCGFTKVSYRPLALAG